MAGELFINVLSARGLRDVEGFGGGKNDPYTKLIHYSSKGERVVQTPYINEAGANPVWTNQEFKFDIVQPQSEELKVEVWDYNIGKDVIIGSVVFPVHQLLYKEGENFYTLTYGTPENRKTAGEVCLKFTYRADKSIAAASQAHAAPQAALFMQPANVKSGPAPAPVPTHGPAPVATIAGSIPPPGPTPGPITLERRKQTLTVLMFFLTPWLCILASIYCVRLDGFPFYFFLLYVGWILLFQEYNRKGGLPIKFIRELAWWRWFAAFFPMKLVKVSGASFPTSKNYIFGVHPHGIISLGAFINFGTEATGWSHQFPGVYPHLCTLRSNFMIPFYGFYLSSLGIIDASKESIKYVLGKGVGESVAIVLGGAKESLDAKPGTYDLTLKERKGFVKIAIETGASLVPCFSFGENEVYDQVNNSVGTPLRKLQDRMEQLMGFALPLIKGRGVFNYSFGLLPHRRAIVTVIGAPIPVDKATPTPELVDKIHKQYIDALTKLYEDHKKEYSIDPNADLKIK